VTIQRDAQMWKSKRRWERYK